MPKAGSNIAEIMTDKYSMTTYNVDTKGSKYVFLGNVTVNFYQLKGIRICLVVGSNARRKAIFGLSLGSTELLWHMLRVVASDLFKYNR